MAETPNLDWLADDLYFDHLTAVLTLDALRPRGSPAAEHCGCCADETVRMREQRRRSHVSGGKSRVFRLCVGCDRSPSEMTLPEGW